MKNDATNTKVMLFLTQQQNNIFSTSEVFSVDPLFSLQIAKMKKESQQ